MRAPLPFGRTAVIFVTILGLFLAPFRDKIAATSDQMRFLPENALKCAADLFTVDSRRVVSCSALEA